METCDYPLAMARRYDRDYAAMGRTQDVDFYVGLAEQAAKAQGPGGGALLEMACGTGRVLLPIARALAAGGAPGATVTGVDPSQPMRQELMAKLAREPEAVRGSVRVLAGRFDRVPVPGPFALDCAPFRAFQHLAGPAEQRAAVAAIAAVLAPGGTLAFDVFDFDPEHAAKHKGHPDCAYEEGGRRIERRSQQRYDAASRRLHLELRWYADGEATGEAAGCAMTIVSAEELAALVQGAGLRLVDVYGDFDRSPREAGRPRELVVVATKPA